MAKLSHKRDANARRKPTAAVLAGSLAVLATGAAVAAGVAVQEPASGREDVVAVDPASEQKKLPAREVKVDLSERQRVVSRSSGGRDAVADAGALHGGSAETGRVQAETRWTTEDLNLWTAPGKAGQQDGEVAEGSEVAYTGATRLGRDQVVVDGDVFWVTAGHLSEEQPVEEAPAEGAEGSEASGSTASGTGGTCTNGSSLQGGEDPSIPVIHQAVCARWPSVTSYGTWRSDGEHGQGRAIDIMVSGGTGWEIAEYLRANYSSFGIEYIIYSQKIWSVERSGEGWRGMEDRGSTTANHYDHVHVTVY